ncbi:hypothetical protein GCM10008967_12260 [Bacillus carboniphilus]|uniref:DUF58 domain-containing protein n=1 Tax=Bacillus carboniphilus TaxID=86663 RepID=A0ABN0W2F6_9BACI
MWYRFYIRDRNIDLASKILLLFMILSIMFNSVLGVYFSILVFLFFKIQSLYLEYVGERLLLKNPKERIYLYKEDKGSFNFQFENNGLPILSGYIKIFIDSTLDPLIVDDEMTKENAPRDSSRGLVEVTLPFALGYRRSTNIEIPFEARTRGLAKVRKVEVVAKHPFGIGEVSLSFNYPFKQEALVFPTKRKIANPVTFPTTKEGQTPQNYSLHENILSTVGTRDYISSDSFKHIDWKATARRQELQTKIFEKASEHSVFISLNILDGYHLVSDLEEYIEKMAYLAKSFNDRDISFGIAVNVRTFGRTPFLYIPIGNGRDHLLKVFECLSLIDYQSMTIPYEKLIYFIAKQNMATPNWVNIGFSNEKINNLLYKVSFRKYNMFGLSEDGQSLVPYTFMKDKRGQAHG